MNNLPAAPSASSYALPRITRLDEMDDKIEKLEAHRQGHLDIRQKALSTWVRDALGKDTERRKQDIRRLNKEVVHGGDVRSDAMVVTERFGPNSTETLLFFATHVASQLQSKFLSPLSLLPVLINEAQFGTSGKDTILYF